MKGKNVIPDVTLYFSYICLRGVVQKNLTFLAGKSPTFHLAEISAKHVIFLYTNIQCIIVFSGVPVE